MGIKIKGAINCLEIKLNTIVNLSSLMDLSSLFSSLSSFDVSLFESVSVSSDFRELG